MKERIDLSKEKIKSMSFPREEMGPLLKDLIEGGFSEEEAWRILAHAKMSKREIKENSTRASIEMDKEGWEQSLRESGEFSESELQKINSHINRQPAYIEVKIHESPAEKIPIIIEHNNKEKE